MIVRKGRERLFEDPYYKSIYGSNHLSFYLSKYWLMRQVQYAARGVPVRAYPKWLVLNFAWKEISRSIGSGYSEKRFRFACEHNLYSEVLNPLLYALTDTFRAALTFYRLNRGKGDEARDVSTFFQLTKLDVEFEKFWGSSKNPYRNKVKNHFKKFRERLEVLEIDA